MSKRKLLISLVLWAVMTVTLFAAIDTRLAVRHYAVESDKVNEPIRLAVLTDFHGCRYGEGAAELIAAVEAERPDAVLLVGDIFDDVLPWDQSIALVSSLSRQYPCYYVTGNHEYWSKDVPSILDIIADSGVTALSGSSAELTINGQTIFICGVPDPYAGGNTEDYLARAAGNVDPDAFTVLLAHRPELIDKYAATGDFDLVVSGHAHGGQVRIPFLVNGLYAPNQGFFPKYAGGMYEVDGTTMIVSRGLARESTAVPRVFNRPELVMVEVK